MYLIVKRTIDFIFSLISLLILSPVFLILVIAIKVDSKGPVLFKQKRVGIHKTHFDILKFRTMQIDAPKDAPTHLLANPEQYITRVGKFLRKTSLDELPQLVNILTGTMTLIGPRPALWNQFDLIAERDKYGANDILPGLTGWAQINGRDTVSIADKAWYDGEYVRKIGIRMDINVFVKTICLVLNKTGVLEGGCGAIEDIKVAKNMRQKQSNIKENATKVGVFIIGLTTLGGFYLSYFQ
jgi:O-antigen biosynthesis protein WbqP